jgi:hypothetical protein
MPIIEWPIANNGTAYTKNRTHTQGTGLDRLVNGQEKAGTGQDTPGIGRDKSGTR